MPKKIENDRKMIEKKSKKYRKNGRNKMHFLPFFGQKSSLFAEIWTFFSNIANRPKNGPKTSQKYKKVKNKTKQKVIKKSDQNSINLMGFWGYPQNPINENRMENSSVFALFLKKNRKKIEKNRQKSRKIESDPGPVNSFPKLCFRTID